MITEATFLRRFRVHVKKYRKYLNIKDATCPFIKRCEEYRDDEDCNAPFCCQEKCPMGKTWMQQSEYFMENDNRSLRKKMAAIIKEAK
jgi:hypothetical protein